MTERLYFDDSYLCEWNARIVERTMLEEQAAVILDRSAFYPTGGGQPHDRGEIAGCAVVDVRAREDGAVLHLLAQAAPKADKVACALEWPRRLDLMQHHSAQHILTQACVRELGAATIGFHLTEDNATIDLDRVVDDAEIDAALALANQIVMENRAIHCAWFTGAALAGVRMRGVGAREQLRVVEIVGFDATACGGTHVRATGELGLIQITRRQQRGESKRLTFVCGGRALRDYRAKNAILQQLSVAATRSMFELPAAFARQREEIQRLKRQVKRMQSLLIERETRDLLAAAETMGSLRVVRKAYPVTAEFDLHQLAGRLQAHSDCVALLGRAGEAAQLLFVSGEAGPELLQSGMVAALALLPGAELAFVRGERAQSKPFEATEGDLEVALTAATQRIRAHSGL